jgi:hypothetical protein
MDWQSDLKKFSLARMDMQASINNMQDPINSLEECDKLNQEIKEDQRRTIIALRQKIAMKHGRKYTGKYHRSSPWVFARTWHNSTNR